MGNIIICTLTMCKALTFLIKGFICRIIGVDYLWIWSQFAWRLFTLSYSVSNQKLPAQWNQIKARRTSWQTAPVCVCVCLWLGGCVYVSCLHNWLLATWTPHPASAAASAALLSCSQLLLTIRRELQQRRTTWRMLNVPAAARATLADSLTWHL